MLDSIEDTMPPKKRQSRQTRSRKTKSNPRPTKSIPRTAKSRSRRTARRSMPSRANQYMSMEQLQEMARDRGIPWAGLNKSRLARKINSYY